MDTTPTNQNAETVAEVRAECIALYQAIFTHAAGSPARRFAIARYQKANTRRAELKSAERRAN